MIVNSLMENWNLAIYKKRFCRLLNRNGLLTELNEIERFFFQQGNARPQISTVDLEFSNTTQVTNLTFT